MRLFLGITALSFSVLTLSGCGSSDSDIESTELASPTSSSSSTTSPTTSTAAPTLSRPVALDLSANLDGDKVAVTGETGLPDGSVLSVSLGRASAANNDPEKGYFEVDRVRAIVQNGKFSGTLTDKHAQDPQEFVDAYNYNEPPEAQLFLIDEVQITVTFDPRKDQPDDVVDAVGGPDGLNLVDSPAANEIGGWTDDPYTELKAMVDLAMPA